jgi:hypothetical protein
VGEVVKGPAVLVLADSYGDGEIELRYVGGECPEETGRECNRPTPRTYGGRSAARGDPR